MNEHSQIDQNSVGYPPANETCPGTRIEAIIAMVSYLQSETQPHNPIAAYFLEMCRFSLQNPDLTLERYPLLLNREAIEQGGRPQERQGHHGQSSR